ncbi:hypothetical protein [Microcoleus sp. CAWBG640]|uniref:hypothetical protein n=1 Tax=Microcoleus sp. CAWBG640 TaxID=2841653 RepID=UPI00312B7B17
MNPRAAADWSARLVTVSVVKTLPIDLSEVVYIAIEPPPSLSLKLSHIWHLVLVKVDRLPEKVFPTKDRSPLSIDKTVKRSYPVGNRPFHIAKNSQKAIALFD